MNEQKVGMDAASEERAEANKKVTLAVTILCTIISLAYVAEVFKGARTVGYVLIVIALAAIPVVGGQVLCKINPASPRTKQVIVYIRQSFGIYILSPHVGNHHII